MTPGPRGLLIRIAQTSHFRVMRLVWLFTLFAGLWTPAASRCRLADPSFTEAPRIDQIDLHSVKVSWGGLLEKEECVDGMIVKWWRSSLSSVYYNISDKLPVNRTEFTVRNLYKKEEYTFQVIAFENEGWMSPIKYNYSPKRTFKTSQQKSDDYFGFDVQTNEDNVAIDNSDDTNDKDNEMSVDSSTDEKETAVGITTNENEDGGTADDGKVSFLSQPKKRKKGFFEENLFLIIIGGCVGGIILIVVLITIFSTVNLKLCKKASAEAQVEEPGDTGGPPPVPRGYKILSNREQKVLSLLMKSGKK